MVLKREIAFLLVGVILTKQSSQGGVDLNFPQSTIKSIFRQEFNASIKWVFALSEEIFGHDFSCLPSLLVLLHNLINCLLVI